MSDLSARAVRDGRGAEVVVVGAGPTGLLLAGDLAAAGVRVVLLERRSGESNLSRAIAVHARTLEALDMRGIAEDLLGTGEFLPTLRLVGTPLELFRLPTRFAGVLMTPQYETERVLEERAVRFGADIRYGAEVMALRQHGDGVDLDVRTDTGTDTLRAGYAVGTDGMRSAVRQSIGLPFPGRSVLRSVMLADVRLETVPRYSPAVASAPQGISFIASLGKGWYRVIAWDRDAQPPADAPVGLDEIRTVTRDAFGTDFGMHDARWTSRFHSDERQAPHYRVGRVFLAGDAAHVHSPAGGMGMNTGLQDAANLGWKLAAAVRGRAGATLLDSYEAERHPVGKLVLRLSGSILRGAVIRSPLLRGARAAAINLAMQAPPVRQRAAMAVSGLGIDYPAPSGAHPLTGRRAPDLPLALDAGEEKGPSRLYEAMREGGFVRVVPRGDSADSGEAGAGSGAPEGVRVTVRRADAAPTTLLIRPDGHVAWASDRPDPAGLRAALAALTGVGEGPLD
ncbi:FAD-dependent monooxygenase [Streptomyces varsoviensis]|uniref:FAD-dependent oxidoreductase n=1 Tax=Streptomyces varsoviensis TaxID=67373 RepID=A0ABR5JBS5_9ACTN|nr:FAD-dependent monooxygenase [Streptomyces varsoviensis]KOG90845.1 FAD-dependent oxidoreductase [Streptomyces varsoviensis]